MPTMTSMYANPVGASMYMPAGNVTTAMAAPSVYSAPRSFAPVMQAAPITTAAAPMTTAMPMTTAAPSYVAQSAFSQYGPGYVDPYGKQHTGLVDPKTMDAERLAYEKALAAQLDKQSKAILEEAAIKKKMLEQTRDTQIKQMELQLDEQLKMASLQVDKQAADTVNGLKEAAILQSTSAQERAALAVEEYKKAKAMEDMARQSYDLQKKWYDHEAQLMAQYQKVAKAGAQNQGWAPQMPMPMAVPFGAGI